MANTKPLVLLTLIAIIAASLAIIPALSQQQAAAQLAAAGAAYREHGTVTSASGVAVTKSLYNKVGKWLSIVLTTSGTNFNSTKLNVYVSQDGTTFIKVDELSLGTNSIFGVSYDDANLSNLSNTAINVLNFPYIKFTTSAGISAKTETLTWSIK